LYFINSATYANVKPKSFITTNNWTYHQFLRDNPTAKSEKSEKLFKLTSKKPLHYVAPIYATVMRARTTIC